MKLLAKMICYAKLFMPANTVLDSKPSPTCIDECRKWDTTMRDLGKLVQINVMAFIDKYQKKTHRSKKPFVQGVVRHLQKIPYAEFPAVVVIDRTYTTHHPSNIWYYRSIAEFK